MQTDNLGVCCIINQLRDKGVFTSRTLIKRTFTMEKASALALTNATDLYTLLKWCVSNNINTFRIGSDFFPRMTEVNYSVDDLKDGHDIKAAFAVAGKYAYTHGINLSCHPGPFTIISSPKDDVNKAGIKDLLMHHEIGKLLNQDANNTFDINFHINSSYGGDYQGTASRFISNFKLLPEALQKQLCLENDDRQAGWSVNDYYNYIHKHTNIPITFDAHHFLFKNDGETMEAAFNVAKSTWNGRKMQVHYSQSPDANTLIPAHSNYYRDPMPDFLYNDPNVYIHLEAKAKEQALFHYRSQLSKHHQK